jgi:hypothetical protein
VDFDDFGEVRTTNQSRLDSGGFCLLVERLFPTLILAWSSVGLEIAASPNSRHLPTSSSLKIRRPSWSKP